jgi:hypothetical protein
VVAWDSTQLAGLREVCRILPDPPRAAVGGASYGRTSYGGDGEVDG